MEEGATVATATWEAWIGTPTRRAHLRVLPTTPERGAPGDRADERAGELARPGRPMGAGACVVRRRRRLLPLVALVTLLVVLSSVAALGGSGGAVAGSQGDAEITVVVGPGETLWDLVLPYAPAGADAQAWVAEVVTLNGVDARRLPPGAVLRVPRR